MSSPFFTAKSYFLYLFRAKGAYGLHSPFVFQLYKRVIQKSGRNYPDAVIGLRKKLLSQEESFDVVDLKNGSSKRMTISAIARSSLSSPKFMNFVRLLCDYLKAEVIVETGTSLGVNALSMSLAETIQKVVTIEGSEILHQLAKKNCKESSKITLVSGNLHDVLEPSIVRYQPDVVFLDADHRSSAVQFSIDKILHHCPFVKCIIIHDIYWSRDMNDGWRAIVKNPLYPLTIDVFQAGIIFPTYSIEKQHFTLRF